MVVNPEAGEKSSHPDYFPFFFFFFFLISQIERIGLNFLMLTYSVGELMITRSTGRSPDCRFFSWTPVKGARGSKGGHPFARLANWRVGFREGKRQTGFPASLSFFLEGLVPTVGCSSSASLVGVATP